MFKGRKPAVAHDVARLAGVSQSAVSRAFTPGASISPETREKVNKAAAALNYRPNIAARSLITRRSGVIGVTMARLDQFNPHLLEGLNAALRDAGYGTLLFVIDPDRDADPVLDDALRRQVDGFVLASTRLSSSFARECRNAGIPVVLLNRSLDDESTHSVTGDDVGGSAKIARFLLRAGHERFAYISGLKDSSTSQRRERGFTEELRRAGVKKVDKAPGQFSFSGAQKAARALFSNKTRPDAIYCASDYMALAVLDVARHEFGQRVPEDVSIVGFGDVVAASWPSYSLTTYSNPVAPLVTETMRILSMALQKPESPAERIVLPGSLVVRTSSRLPPEGLTEAAGTRIWDG